MAINIEGICKAYDGRAVLQDLSMTLEKGQCYCLMAPSGAGKTTLFRLLMGLETADRGRITGIAPGDIAVMFQEDRLLMHLSPVQNVLPVCTEKPDLQQIRKNLLQILPAECLEQPVRELSGGMKRRVALARALYYPGRLILLDEPFTGLDRETKEAVIHYLQIHRNGRTLLMATHDREDAELLDAEILHLERA